MKILKLLVVTAFVIALALATASRSGVLSQTTSEAPTGFDNKTNGLVAQATFDADKLTFEERDEIADGLGPVYNAQSCAECHQNPVTGAISQITEFRAGHLDGFGNFVDAPGGSLLNDRATNAQIQERRPGTETVFSFRTSLNTLGDGFVEAVSNTTLQNIANAQPGQSGGAIAGQLVAVPVAEAGNATRFGRFGWKNQQASLLSFAADAYVNEQGVTSRLQPTETTTLCDTVADPEDHPDAAGLADIDHFARFMRATQAPPRDTALAATADAQTGATLFHNIGCDICHVSSITTSPAGTVINGGQFTVPAALGSKIIHPYSDFLLHNVGTGDGIVQNGPQDTANKMRTTPLWGLRNKSRLMHDLSTFTRNNAILRHGGEATGVINNYRSLSDTQKNQLITFLQTL
jgi:CxxC motif-containing protein (DUF1111 family)